MSDDPNQQPLNPQRPESTEPPPEIAPSDPTVVWQSGAGTTPPVDPAPALDGGLVSATPVGWTGQDIGAGTSPPPPPSWGASPPPPADAPMVHWAAPTDTGRDVPGAPGLKFAGAGVRFVAYVLDWFLVAIVAGLVGAAAGLGTTTRIVTETSSYSTVSVTGPAFTLLWTALGFIYFVGLWSGGRRSTLGQRLFGVQVGNAFDGKPLSLSQAIRRWFGLGSIIGLLALAPSLVSTANGLELIWFLVLLVTTVFSPTKQGLHDRLANSAVARPAGAGGGKCVLVGCGLLIGIVVLIAVIGLVGFALFADQFTRILSQVGNSI